MKRDNIVNIIEERDLKQFQQILEDVFNNTISYEKMQNLYKISKENKDIYILGYYIDDNLVGTVTLNILTLPSGKDATIWDLAIQEDIKRIWLFSGFHRKCAHELYRKLGYDENRDKAFVKEI